MNSKKIRQPFRQIDPDTVELREGGGCVSVFGLPFLAAGLFVMSAGFGFLSVEGKSASFFGRLGIVAFGSVFALVGGLLVFGRSWIIIDRRQKRIVRQWGLLTPMHTKEDSLSGYQKILLRFIPGDSDTSDAYPVELSGSGKTTVMLCKPSNRGEAVSAAFFVSNFLNLPVEDSTRSRSDDEVFLTDKGMLAERLAKEEETVERVSRPLEARSVVEEGGETRRLTIPSEGFHPWSLVKLIIPVVILWMILYRLFPFFERTATPDIVQNIAAGFIGIFFILIPVLSYLENVFGQLYGYERISVGPEGISIEQKTGWRKHVSVMPLSDVISIAVDAVPDDYREFLKSVRHSSPELQKRAEETVVVGGSDPWWFKMVRRLKSKGVVLNAISGTFTVGRGISHQEARYICAWIKQSIKRSAGSLKKGNEHES